MLLHKTQVGNRIGTYHRTSGRLKNVFVSGSLPQKIVVTRELTDRVEGASGAVSDELVEPGDAVRWARVRVRGRDKLNAFRLERLNVLLPVYGS